MDLQETQQFGRVLDNLSRIWPTLPNVAATEAVNFTKERFRAANWVDNTTIPWKQRKAGTWRKRGRDARPGRALLVDSGRLKRDVNKIYVGADRAIIGTSRLTEPYAQAHNEGFRGTVTQNVKAHNRKLTKLGIVSMVERKRSTGIKFGRVVTGEAKVKAFVRRIRQNIPQRQFMGASSVLDKRIERQLTAKIIQGIKNA